MNNTAISRRTFLAATAAGSAGVLFSKWMTDAFGETAPMIDLGVSQSLQNHALIKQAGFQYIEGNVGQILMPKANEAEFAKRRSEVLAASLPVRACVGFIPGELKLVGPEAQLDAAVRYATVALQRAKTVGVTRIVLGSGASRQLPEGFTRGRAEEQLVEFAKRIAPVAQANGVIVVLENLQRKECNFINRVEEGLKVVEAVNHPGFQLHVDIFHMLREDEGPESITKAGARLKHCHIATKKSRRPPGMEDDDFRPYLKALKKIDYRGGISMECGWKNLEEELPVAYRELRKQLQ